MKRILPKIILIAFVAAIGTAAQSRPLSLCEVIKHPEKYNNKEILIQGVFYVAAEISPLRPSGECSKYGSITAGPDQGFEKLNDPEMIEKFHKATDLLSAISDDGRFTSTFCCEMQMNITARGLFQYSRKKKFGPFNAFKMAFLIRHVEDISDAKMVLVGNQNITALRLRTRYPIKFGTSFGLGSS